LTKVYEETVRGSLAEVLEYFKSKTLKGEFVIVVGGKED
jgi:16S rRNA (cytidine1402-2'-O)-methyltransferase